MPETDTWIHMPDGVRLAATLYLPEGGGPWPAILEALPYRKDDVTASHVPEYRRLRDEGGYAVCRVDLRGTGDSDGLAVDEYPPEEQKDLCEVIDWLAGQAWCTGAVGMYGTSYSGFNSIQVAMERPPALKAIIPIFATDDRYTDDVHYGGGARRALDFVDYPTYMVALNALPPTPSVAGPDWRETWRRRVEEFEPWLIRWVEEQVDGPYWRHGSLRPRYERIACPTMIVAGWADGYRNNSFRTFERLTVPKRLLVGPWSHASVETCLPGPHIDLVREMLRWWDRWLKGERTGVDEEPPIQVFVRRWTDPAPDLAEHRGAWRFEPAWPPERLREVDLPLAEATTPGRAGGGADRLRVRGDVGSSASIWCAGHLPFGQPGDQRPDETFSLVYDWPRVEEAVEVLGYPRLEVTVRSSAPVAFLSAKLCDVGEEGVSALVSRGLLNLTHRDSHQSPQPLEPGRPYAVTVPLDATSWVFEPGHRIRLDVAGSDWPNLWPPPGGGELRVEPGPSRLVLPVLPGPAPVAGGPAFVPPPREREGIPPPEPGPGATAPSGSAKAEPVLWRIEHDVLGRETVVRIGHGSEDVVERGTRVIERYRGEAGVSTEDPGRARALGHAYYSLAWADRTVTSEVRTSLTSGASGWHVEIELAVGEDGETTWSRRWDRRFPRNLG